MVRKESSWCFLKKAAATASSTRRRPNRRSSFPRGNPQPREKIVMMIQFGFVPFVTLNQPLIK